MSPTHLIRVENKILLATVALTQVNSRHTERLRWVMRELGCKLGIVANFHPAKLNVRYFYC